MNPSTQHTHEQNATMIPLRLSRSSNLTDLIIGITTSSASSTSRRNSFQQLQQRQQQQQQQSSSVSAANISVKQQQEQLGPLAVVCGRGRVAQTLAGNKRFQCVIEEHLDQYITLKTKQDKSKLHEACTAANVDLDAAKSSMALNQDLFQHGSQNRLID